MTTIDLEKTNIKQLITNINQVYSTYKNNKDFKVIFHYHYVDNKPVGVVYGWSKNKYLYIDIVFVDERYRKKGIATQMLNDVIKKAKGKNIDLIIIELIECYKKYMLKGIVEKLGFVDNMIYLIFEGRLIYYKNIKIEREENK